MPPCPASITIVMRFSFAAAGSAAVCKKAAKKESFPPESALPARSPVITSITEKRQNFAAVNAPLHFAIIYHLPKNLLWKCIFKCVKKYEFLSVPPCLSAERKESFLCGLEELPLTKPDEI